MSQGSMHQLNKFCMGQRLGCKSADVWFDSGTIQSTQKLSVELPVVYWIGRRDAGCAWWSPKHRSAVTSAVWFIARNVVGDPADISRPIAAALERRRDVMLEPDTESLPPIARERFIDGLHIFEPLPKLDFCCTPEGSLPADDTALSMTAWKSGSLARTCRDTIWIHKKRIKTNFPKSLSVKMLLQWSAWRCFCSMETEKHAHLCLEHLQLVHVQPTKACSFLAKK